MITKEGKFQLDKFKPRRATLDRLTKPKLVKRQEKRKTIQEAQEFEDLVMGMIL